MSLKSFAAAALLAAGSLAFVNGPPAHAGTDPLSDGERIFNEICQQCHTLDPPANLAPPMRHILRHLRQSFETDEAISGHIVAFVPAPTAEASALPPMAVERFGLMPALPLPESSLKAVAAYLLTLEREGSGSGDRDDAARPGHGRRHGGGHGEDQGQCVRSGEDGRGQGQCAQQAREGDRGEGGRSHAHGQGNGNGQQRHPRGGG